MLLKGNLKATSRLLQDDIFQDVFENVGLFCGDSHCNVGDAKEECLDPPNQAKSNHQNSSDWKEPGILKFCEGFRSCSFGPFVLALAAISSTLVLECTARRAVSGANN
jgi:hypothetical protein